MGSLLLEILMVILSGLFAKSLLRFRCVCKFWRKLISEPSFVEMHLSRSIENNLSRIITRNQIHLYSIDYDVCGEDRAVKLNDSKLASSDIVGPCNGLLCLANLNNAFLWNPSTGKFKPLPDIPIEFQSNFVSSWGFGYDPKSKEYKMIGILDIYNNGSFKLPPQTEVMFSTFGTDFWRRLGNVPWFTENGIGVTIVRGFPHWIASKRGSCKELTICCLMC